MNTFLSASTTTPPVSAPNLEAPALARLAVPATSLESTVPAGVVAVSANWDTDFRKKIGIERWGWGLND
jgi:hypothetical protein